MRVSYAEGQWWDKDQRASIKLQLRERHLKNIRRVMGKDTTSKMTLQHEKGE